MSYTKHNYKKGDELLASQLNDMDDQIALNEQTADTLVTVSNTQPAAAKNRVWVKATPSEIEIPTMEDHNDLSRQLSDVESALMDTGYGIFASRSKANATGAWAEDYEFNGVEGSNYFVMINKFAPTTGVTTLQIIIMHNSTPINTLTSNAVVGESYRFRASGDFNKIRVRAVYSAYPVTNLVQSVNFGTETKNVIGKVANLESDVDVLHDSNGYIINASKVWANARTLTFDADIKANQPLYFAINSADDANFVTSTVYLYKSDMKTYVVAKSILTLGVEYSYTPTEDYQAIRFYISYETAPQNNTISVSYGTKSKLFNQETISAEFDDIETNYISGICAPCAIGDSLTEGLVISGVSGISNYADNRFSWATQLFKKENNTEVNIVAKSGATPRTILTDKATEISQINACDCVCVYMGTNQDKDASNNYFPIGTVADIVENWDDTPTDTFIGWYSKLLKTISHYNSPYGFGVCFGLVKHSMKSRTDAIELICNNIDGWIFQPTEKYSDLLTRLIDNDDGTHYSPIGYAGYKAVFKKALNEAIFTHPTMVNKTANIFR